MAAAAPRLPHRADRRRGSGRPTAGCGVLRCPVLPDPRAIARTLTDAGSGRHQAAVHPALDFDASVSLANDYEQFEALVDGGEAAGGGGEVTG